MKRLNRKGTYLGIGVVVGASATLAAPQALLFVSPSAYAAAADTYRQLNLFGDIFERVRSHYVEKPDDSKLVEGAVNGMLNGLDPHSSYLDPKSLRDMHETGRMINRIEEARTERLLRTEQ